MSQSDWIEYKKEVRERLRVFALAIIDLSGKLPNSTRSRVINYQVTKSGSSMYANYRAALRARSKREFFSKMSIVVEETDETEMWLELLIASKISDTAFTKEMHSESLELLKILSSMRKRLSK